MKKTTNKKKRSIRKKLSPEEQRKLKEQREHIKGIREIFQRLGFSRITGVDGKNFTYEGRTSELDDIFVCENIIAITEYTTVGKPSDHLTKKNLIYTKINNNPSAFIDFLTKKDIYEKFTELYNNKISNKYSINELQIRIIYCSLHAVDIEYKTSIQEVIYFDFHIVKYFQSLSSVIKRSALHEFLDFINVKEELFGINITSSLGSDTLYECNILPEENSSFAPGYKIISFYIDAESLIRRAYVLRQESWRDKENIGFYQRMLEQKKIASMRKYLAEKRRVFINNIIATISEDDIIIYTDKNKREQIHIDWNGNFESNNKITKVTSAFIAISNKSNIVGIIDGQHRTFAYYEGTDQYESEIELLRKRQNLLVTGIIFPKSENKETKLKFEANLFLEINSNQKKVSSKIQQEIQLHTQPFASIAIGKSIIFCLNNNGPISNMVEMYSFEKGKIKTASIVDFGLKPLIKIDSVRTDTLFTTWDNPSKQELVDSECTNYELREEYIKYCAREINQMLSAFKSRLGNDKWHPFSTETKQGVLTVTFINGVLNLIRILIQNNKLTGLEYYLRRLTGVDDFKFKEYKSSQYRKLGEALYDKYFKV